MRYRIRAPRIGLFVRGDAMSNPKQGRMKCAECGSAEMIFMLGDYVFGSAWDCPACEGARRAREIERRLERKQQIQKKKETE